MDRHGWRARHVIALWLAALIGLGGGQPAAAAPYASMVMDARDGRVIRARNHDTRLHPASLTKMMTLYIAFEAVRHGELTLDTELTVSRNAANTPCSCLGVRAGQKIALRYLIRAAALRSANDATIVIAEGISGSVDAFAQRMTRTARAMGMENTTFRNPHGLTQQGHVSTARDMTILGRQLLFDYPEYYNIFSRRSDHAGIATVPNTNRNLLNAYRGADGIKTGFTRAAGFNLTASAERGDVRIIVTMFGGTSGAARNAHVARLLDIGFDRAATRVATRPPATPAYGGPGGRAVAVAEASPAASSAPKAISAVRQSLRPATRPGASTPEPALPSEALAALQQSVGRALAVEEAPPSVTPPSVTPPERPDDPAQLAEADLPAGAPRVDKAEPGAPVLAEAPSLTPPSRPEEVITAAASQDDIDPEAPPADVIAADLARASEAGFSVIAPEVFTAVTDAAELAIPDPATAIDDDPEAPTPEDGVQFASAAVVRDIVEPALGVPTPEPRAARPEAPAVPQPDARIELTSSADAEPDKTLHQASASPAAVGTEIISRMSTSGGRLWGVTIGSFPSRHEAERQLIQTALAESVALENGLRRIRQTSGAFEAAYTGLTQSEADLACRRLQARGRTCFTVAP